MAGGLGVRVANLSRALAQEGFPTHLFFIGDPDLRGEETTLGGKLNLHRWCQWISRYYPRGVYEGEDEKVNDFNSSIPGFVTDRIIKSALEKEKLVVVLGEEWHTAETMCRLSDLLLAILARGPCHDRAVREDDRDAEEFARRQPNDVATPIANISVGRRGTLRIFIESDLGRSGFVEFVRRLR